MNNKSDQSMNQPGGLPLFAFGLGAGSIKFSEPASFWDDARRTISEGVLGDHLDAAMTGHSSPRVWLFLHEPGESHLSVAAALAFARQLAHRDQAVLLLDGDDDNAELTQWADRKDTDGWIDLVRYGASVLTSGVPMPFEGRRGYLLGVGSFTPAEVTRPEVKDLVSRLKRQADDILVVAPADTAGRLWASEADIRLLCWDRAQRSASLVDDLVENFSAANIPLMGLIGFGLPQSSDASADAGLDEILQEKPVRDAAFILDELAEEEAAEEAIDEEEEFARRKGNSGVFWMVAIISVVMIGAASVYYMKFLKVPTTGHFPASVHQDVAMGGAAFFDSGSTTFQDDAVLEGEHEEVVESITQETDQPADEPSLAENSRPGDEVQEAEPETTTPVVEEAREVDPPVEDEVKVAGTFSMDPYLTPAGVDGWSLHVYSFPDSMSAEKERKILAAKGFQSTTRVVHFKDKGRWFRLYLGNFKTKAEANKARKLLMAELGEDWANPVRF